jgi:predicted nucleotidyltransferase
MVRSTMQAEGLIRLAGKLRDVNSERKAPTIDDARQIANLLVAAFPAIDAVLLFGSVARGDANSWSDIDLAIIGSDENLTPEQLRYALTERDERVSLIYYPAALFRKLYDDRALFIAHLKKEGIALHDPQGLFKTLLSQPFIPNVDVARELSAQRAKLAPYSDPRRFNNNFLFCLSHLYSIGKGVIMLGLAKRGILEFNRDAAFRRFAALNPDLAKETEKVAQLRPFYRLVTKRQREPLPFPYESANHQLQEAVAAIETLARRTETL